MSLLLLVVVVFEVVNSDIRSFEHPTVPVVRTQTNLVLYEEETLTYDKTTPKKIFSGAFYGIAVP